MTRPVVLVDLLFFTGRKGGMESYVREVYSRISPDDADVRFVGFASRELAAAGAAWFPGLLIDSGISGENRIEWALGELFAVSRAARRIGADLVHCPANFGPLRPMTPVVLTVHDLLPFRHPEYVPGRYASVLRGLIRRAARRAERVLTVSRSSREDVVRLLGVPSHRVDVIPLAGTAVDDLRSGMHSVLRRPDQLLSVGNRMPHKNVDRLLEAFAAIPPERRPRLVITGSGVDDPLLPIVHRLRLGDHVELRGWIDEVALERLYRESTALVFPTLFEGFGLPILEAMSRGCPVICSDLPVTREVAADAARYVDPADVTSITQAIESVLGDAALRERMSAAGRSRAAAFSWERTAHETRTALVDAIRR